jgi:DNA primase
MQSRTRERAKRIRKEIPIVLLLNKYGYRVNPNGVDRDQQFSCDLHGDGKDSSPSARAYSNSNSWYCFACGISRDPVKTVQEKEGLSFADACTRIEILFGLPALPWQDFKETEHETALSQVEAALKSPRSFPQELDRLSTFLLNLTSDKTFQDFQILQFWELLDAIAYASKAEGFDQEKGKKQLAGIKNKIISSIKEEM